MDPVSNTDRLVLILRQKLQERARLASSARKGRGERAAKQATSGADGIYALASIEGVDDRQLRRAFIQNLLSDQFGAELINDAQFQQVVTRVTEAIEEESVATRLLSRLIKELRAS